MKKTICIFLFLLIMPSFVYCGEFSRPKPLANIASDNLLDLEFIGLDGANVYLKDYKGKPVALVFWATWCYFCRRELNKMKESYPRLKEEGIEVIAVNIGESPERVISFVEANSFKFKVVLDPDSEAAASLKIMGVPTYLILNDNLGLCLRANSFPYDDYKQVFEKCR